jgi:hypothetical protein
MISAGRVRPALAAGAGRVGPALAVAALAAGAVAWAALPAAGATQGLKPVLIAAIMCAVMTIARLIAGQTLVASRDPGRTAGLAGFAGRTWASIRVLPWPQAMTVAVLGLEALHQSRPWHTAVLGVALIAFLLALHLADTAAGPSVFRPHLPLLAAGLGLAALSAGAAMIPPLGAGSGLLAVVAAIAAVLVAALALPL